jgi:peptidoglycan/LPS O-acetylase OafA/YrhL
MGRPWSADSAVRLVSSLLLQRDRKALTEAATRAALNRRHRVRTRTALAAIASLVLAASTVLLAGTALPQPATLCVLLAGPMFGAVGGALLRESTDERPDAVWSAARGLGAGMLSAMLYVASQLLTTPDLLTSDATPRLLWFVVPLGIAAGYTFDLVYARLRRAEVLPSQPFDPGAVTGGP